MDSRFGRLLIVGAIMGAVAACSAGNDEASPDSSQGASALAVDGIEVFVIDRSPDAPIGPTILFLHGASFDATVWVRTGILDAVVEHGTRAIAVDLPGFGSTPSIDEPRGQFLAGLIDAVDDGHGVVVVSPSMSGAFSFDLIATSGADSMLGFVPVAPAGITGFAAALPQPVDGLPTMIVWGSDDRVIDIAQADVLATALPQNARVVLDGAGHAAYQDQPDAFTNALLDFVGQFIE